MNLFSLTVFTFLNFCKHLLNWVCIPLLYIFCILLRGNNEIVEARDSPASPAFSISELGVAGRLGGAVANARRWLVAGGAGGLLEEVGGGARVGAPHGRRLAQRHWLLAALRVQLVRVGAALAVAEAGDRRHGDQEEGRAQADAHQCRRGHWKQNALMINRISRVAVVETTNQQQMAYISFQWSYATLVALILCAPLQRELI